MQPADRPTRVASCRLAHCLLLKGIDGPGRVFDVDVARFCKRISVIYKDLSRQKISYVTVTQTAEGHGDGSVYGCGLNFVALALNLIDGSAKAPQAKRYIELVRWNLVGGRRRDWY